MKCFPSRRRWWLTSRTKGGLAVGGCAVLLMLQGYPAQSQPTASSPGPPTVKVNRTAPKVLPPKNGLEFSAQPTIEEISQARVFEEPLVPIGGEPNAHENAALAAALQGYAKRSGPDDFV